MGNIEIINRERLVDLNDKSFVLALQKKPVAIVCNLRMKELMKDLVPGHERKLDGMNPLLLGDLPGAQVVLVSKYPDVLVFCKGWDDVISQFGHAMESDQLAECKRMRNENFNGWGLV